MDKRWNEKDAKFLQHLILLAFGPGKSLSHFLPKTYSVGKSLCVIGKQLSSWGWFVLPDLKEIGYSSVWSMRTLK